MIDEAESVDFSVDSVGALSVDSDSKSNHGRTLIEGKQIDRLDRFRFLVVVTLDDRDPGAAVG